MAVMRGSMPLKTMAHYMNPWKFWWLRLGLRVAGRMLIPTVPFKEAYFLEDAKKFRQELKMPLIYVGGLVSREKIEEVLDAGFVAVQMARALVHDPAFVRHLQEGETRCQCGHSNYCIARMYSLDMRCHHCVESLPSSIKKEIEKAESPGV